MADVAREAEHAAAPAAPPARRLVSERLLLDAVSALAVAGTETEVASTCLPLLLMRGGARAAAVLQRCGPRVVILGSAGYPCGAMAVGADLPLDAGLPATEAVRTGRTVVQGSGPSWVAAPFGDGRQPPGALLLSLDRSAPGPADVVALQRLALVLGGALLRAAGVRRTTTDLAVLAAGLRSVALLGGPVETAVRSEPAEGGAGGDVLACLPDGAGGTWLVAADVCGNGLPAALVAHSVRATLRACAGTATGPAGLLAALDAAVVPDIPTDGFVTVLAVHVAADGRTARVASAGHPPPLVVQDGEPAEVAVEPGPPMALAGRVLPALSETPVQLAPGSVLVLHTDGLTDRRADAHVTVLDPRVLLTALDHDLEQAADAVLAAAAAAGPALDDASLLLARPRC